MVAPVLPPANQRGPCRTCPGCCRPPHPRATAAGTPAPSCAPVPYPGASVRRGQVVLDGPTEHPDVRGHAATSSAGGRSAWTAPGFDLTQLIASREVTTPGRSWVEVQVRGRAPSGRRTEWGRARPVGRRRPNYVRRTSVPGQGDDLADVNVDTWQTASSTGLASWQLRVTLLRHRGRPQPEARRGRRDGLAPARRLWAWRPPTPDPARASCCGCRATRRWRTAATTRSGAAVARPGARRRPRRWSSAGTARCLRPAPTVGCRTATSPHGSTMRPGLPTTPPTPAPGTGLQHRLRRDPDRRRIRHPAAQPPRGAVLHRGGHPARRIDLLRPGPARRTAPRSRPVPDTCW